MTRIRKHAKVSYSASQMYALVNDIGSYPDFLPWCNETNVVNNHGDSLTASVSISMGKIHHTFTTANTMQPDREINMKLVEGPFKELIGHWRFHDTDNGCSVSLDMSFEFKNKLTKHALGAAFKKITDSLVDAFIERARAVYGKQ